jgi:micrococcal nuclease
MRVWLWGLLLACWLGSVGAQERKSPSQAQAKAEAEVWTGWVSWVMDGDTVLVVRSGQKEPVKLRLDAVDAPETCQPGGPAARDAMTALALRKPVQVQSLGRDSYGRDIGRLSVDGVDVGAEMVRSGMAWAYRFRTGRGPYAALQRQAQKEKRGVFAGREEPMSPALFRKFNGGCHGS